MSGVQEGSPHALHNEVLRVVGVVVGSRPEAVLLWRANAGGDCMPVLGVSDNWFTSDNWLSQRRQGLRVQCLSQLRVLSL